MNSCGDLVNVLTACTLRANRTEVDFAEGNNNFVGDKQHGSSFIGGLVHRKYRVFTSLWLCANSLSFQRRSRRRFLQYSERNR